jgi:hypothetical protein
VRHVGNPPQHIPVRLDISRVAARVNSILASNTRRNQRTFRFLWFLLLWLLDLHQNHKLTRAVKGLALLHLILMSLDAVTIFGLVAVNPKPAQTADIVLTVAYTALELLPLVLLGFALARWRSLDLARWLVALTALVDQMFWLITTGISQFSRFTHWTLVGWLTRPLFTLSGTGVSPANLVTKSRTLNCTSVEIGRAHV